LFALENPYVHILVHIYLRLSKQKKIKKARKQELAFEDVVKKSKQNYEELQDLEDSFKK